MLQCGPISATNSQMISLINISQDTIVIYYSYWPPIEHYMVINPHIPPFQFGGT